MLIRYQRGHNSFPCQAKLLIELGTMKTGHWENSPTLHNVCGELVQLQNVHWQLNPNNSLIANFSKKYVKCLLVDNIGLGSPSYSWQWQRLTTDSSHEISALNIALQTISVGMFFWTSFSWTFCRWTSFPCSLCNVDEFSQGRVYLIPLNFTPNCIVNLQWIVLSQREVSI